MNIQEVMMISQLHPMLYIFVVMVIFAAKKALACCNNLILL